MKCKNPTVRYYKVRKDQTVSLSRYANVIYVIGKTAVTQTLTFTFVSQAKAFMNNPTGLKA